MQYPVAQFQLWANGMPCPASTKARTATILVRSDFVVRTNRSAQGTQGAMPITIISSLPDIGSRRSVVILQQRFQKEYVLAEQMSTISNHFFQSHRPLYSNH